MSKCGFGRVIFSPSAALTFSSVPTGSRWSGISSPSAPASNGPPRSASVCPLFRRWWTGAGSIRRPSAFQASKAMRCRYLRKRVQSRERRGEVMGSATSTGGVPAVSYSIPPPEHPHTWAELAHPGRRPPAPRLRPVARRRRPRPPHPGPIRRVRRHHRRRRQLTSPVPVDGPPATGCGPCRVGQPAVRLTPVPDAVQRPLPGSDVASEATVTRGSVAGSALRLARVGSVGLWAGALPGVAAAVAAVRWRRRVGEGRPCNRKKPRSDEGHRGRAITMSPHERSPPSSPRLYFYHRQAGGEGLLLKSAAHSLETVTVC